MDLRAVLCILIYLLGIQREVKGKEEDKVAYLYKYRVVNWCVTGNSEPVLFEWPFVQFKPFLMKTSKFAKYSDFNETFDPYTGLDNDTEALEAYDNYRKNPPQDPPESKVELRFKQISCEKPYYPPLPPWAKLPTIPGAPGAAAPAIPPKQVIAYKNPNDRPYPEFDLPPYPFRPVDPIGHHSHPSNPRGAVDPLYNNFRDTTSPYAGSHFHQRIHIELELTNTDANWEGVEGVLIQANHAPFGMGFPFGQFYRGEDTEGNWPCKCPHSTHRIIPCLSRPDFEFAHPTVAAFHYEMLEYRKADPTQADDYPKKLFRAGLKKELHFNFKWHSHPCSAANLVTFFVLIVHSFYRRRYEIRTFGPYDFSPLQLEDNEFWTLGRGRRPYEYEAREDPDRFNNLRWLVPLSENWVRPTPAGGTATTVRERFKNDDFGGDTRTGYVQNPFYMPSPLFPHCRRQTLPKPSCKIPAPTTPPVPNPCEEKYTLACHDDPYPGRNPETRLYFPNEVKPAIPVITRPDDGEITTYLLRFNGEFDVNCLSNYPLEREPHRQCGNWSGRFRCDERYEGKKLKGRPFTYLNLIERNQQLQTNISANYSDTFFDGTMCEPCKYERSTPATIATTPGEPFIKRTAHGALMCLAFIFLLPVSMLIARYYKETLHTREYKGFRLWLWIHVGTSIFAMILAYAGYNLPTFYELNRHMWIGYCALFCGGFGLITGWGRHKISWLRSTMYWLHSLPSWCSIPLAALSMFWSNSIHTSFAAQWIIIGCVVTIAIVMFALDCQVCTVDKKLGMHPPRPHIPVLQVRFEDTFMDGHKGRVIFLYIFIAALFIAVIVSMLI